MMAAYDAWLLLRGRDEGARRFIARQTGREAVLSAPVVVKAEEAGTDALFYAIVKGLKDDAAMHTKAALLSRDAMDIINQTLVPALNQVGEAFAKGTLFLPQLMMSADASAAAFEVVRGHLPTEAKEGQRKDTVIVATVKGDIHDIGKNIVRALLENYGFHVVDLGKDVDHQQVVDACRQHQCRLVGLSALMTTTVDGMRQTIHLLRANCPDARIMVGGAVLTSDYAREIGADFYAKTAMDSVRYAEQCFPKEA